MKEEGASVSTSGNTEAEATSVLTDEDMPLWSEGAEEDQPSGNAGKETKKAPQVREFSFDFRGPSLTPLLDASGVASFRFE